MKIPFLSLFSTNGSPPPAKVPLAPQSRVGLLYEPLNISSVASVQTIQSAIRSAETGWTRDLFAIYRDLCISGSHIYAELAKRKLAVVGESHSIIPIDNEDAADVQAAEAIKQAISDCENWSDALAHMLDSTLWPVSAAEKIFRPTLSPSSPLSRFTLRRIEPLNPTLFDFRPNKDANPEPNAWEPDLRFFTTGPDGAILWNDQPYLPDPNRHLIHRGHLLTTRDNWGGPMRSIVFWWLLGALGRDWFARLMERFGAPFIVGKTDSANAINVNFLKNALALSTRIGGLVVDHETQIDLKETMLSGAADASEKFLNVCNREISKVIVGQSQSEVKSTGLGSGVSKGEENVREDIRVFDQVRLGETLTRQVFRQILEINGLPGRPPRIVWGGVTQEDAAQLADTLQKLKQAGVEPTDEALPTISERIGFQLQRAAVPTLGVPPSGGPTPFNSQIANLKSQIQHPSDAIAARKAAVLAAAYKGALAPVRLIILNSASEEEALKHMTAFFSDWNPQKVTALTEEALQLCAAAGAVAGKS